MKIKLIFILILFSTLNLLAQDVVKNLEGTVTFVTSSNVYVRFQNTNDVKIGDKLQLNGNSCLEVTEKSSTSVVCSVINDCIVNKGDTVSFTTIITEEVPSEKVENDVAVVVQPKTTNTKQSLYKENIRGRISAASYNSFSNVREDLHRLQTRFSLNANHIGGGKFSIESSMDYRNVISSPENYNGRTNIFNVYDLNTTYQATPNLLVNLGRRINPKASVIGANDGLQVESYFGNFYVGGIVGFRPDFYDYGFNSDLFQYGGFVGVETNTSTFYSTTTLGALEQTNNGATDRRSIFFQHSSTIASKLNLFGSMELDIYGDQGNSTRLTNLYLSARYRFSKAANVMVSYDSRKQILYYETYQSEVERILDDDLARQGLRARINVRPIKLLWLGVSYSSRSQSDNQNKSDNIYGYATLSKIPSVGGSLTISYNMNTSNYLTSNIFSARYSREIMKDVLQGDLYFRSANYDYNNQDTKYGQNFYGLGLSYRISKSWQLSFSGEFSQFEDENNTRIYTQLAKRF